MRRSDAAVMAVVTLAAALARIPGLGRRGLWVDEAFTAIAASVSPAALVDLLRHDSGPPLYYLLVHAVTLVAGTGEAALRAPSAAAGIAGALVVAHVARRLGAGAIGSLLAGLMLALSPLLVHHAQDARYYAFLPLVAALALWSLEDAIRSSASRSARRVRLRWVALAALFTLGAYLHTYGLLLVPAALAYAIGRGVRSWRPLVLASLAALVLYLPWIPVLVEQVRFGATEWAARTFHPLAPLASLEAFVPGGRAPAHVLLPPGPIPPVGVAAVGILLAAGAIGGTIRSRERRSLVAAPALFSLVPMMLVWLVSLAARPIYVVGRADLLFLPGLVTALAVGLSRLGRSPTVLATIAISVLGVSALVPYHRTDVKSGDRALARAIEANARPGDLVIGCGLSYAPLAYYLGGDGASLALVPFPADMRSHPGSVDVRATLESGAAHVEVLERELTAHLSRHRTARIWAALPPGPLGRTLGAVLDARLVRGEGGEETFLMGMLGTPLRLRVWGATTVPQPAPPEATR
jgi:mannosyltransferase